MKYLALLRGINVGGTRRVAMAQLREEFTRLGFHDVTTYINSGNVIFTSELVPDATIIRSALMARFGFDVEMSIISAETLLRIVGVIPHSWLNDTQQKTDVAFLFSDIDSEAIMQRIGYRPEIETFIYTPGALITTISRQNQTRGSMRKIIGTPLYARMTIRNVITARKLAEILSR